MILIIVTPFSVRKYWLFGLISILSNDIHLLNAPGNTYLRPLPNLIYLSDTHSLNTFRLSVLTLSGSDIETRLLQFLNTPPRIRTSIPSANITSLNDIQFANADESMTVTFSGITILFKFTHPLNAYLPIYCKVDGSLTSVKFSQCSNAP